MPTSLPVVSGLPVASFPNRANQPSNSCKIELETPPESRVHPQSPFLSTFTSLLHPRCHHPTRFHTLTPFSSLVSHPSPLDLHPFLTPFIHRPPLQLSPVPVPSSITYLLLTNPSTTILPTRTGLCLNPISAQFYYTTTTQHHPSSPSATYTLFSSSPHLTLVTFDSIYNGFRRFPNQRQPHR